MSLDTGSLRQRSQRLVVVVTVEVTLDLDEYAAEYGVNETRQQAREYVEYNVHTAVVESFRHLDNVSVAIRERR